MARKKSDSQLLAALAYPLWPVALVLLIFEKKDKYVRYHAFQGFGFFVALSILSIAVSLASMTTVFGDIIKVIFWVYAVLAALNYASKAYNGKKFKIPFVYNFLKKNVKEFK
ncbi:DUF4870 domain-containing protein [Candidatus Woesearchaeota archaeon]|nr:DUF4870 domain-containing protein [Candidatus Woesearchaeota archaeon]